MRILLLSQYFWPENFRINEIVKSLRDRGHHVEVLTGKPNYPQGKKYTGYEAWGAQLEEHDGLQISRIPMMARGKGAKGLVANYLSFVLSGLLFAPALLRGKKFDVIFVYAPSPILQAIPAIFLGWLKGIPVTLWVQDLWPESLSATGFVKNKALLKLVEFVVRLIYRHVDLLLVQSEAFVQPVSALAHGTPVVYHANSVDESFSTPSCVPLPTVDGLDGFSVMFAGNIGTAQAVSVIIDAASLLIDYPEIQFVILGEGSRWEWMKQEAQRRNLDNVHLPGRFPIETMPGFMQKASALLVTLADQEIFKSTVPSKVQAYLASGRPIIACLNGEGARLVTEAGAGVAPPAEDGRALADAILRLYKLPKDELDSMGRNGRTYYAQHFEHEKLVGKLIEHLQASI